MINQNINVSYMMSEYECKYLIASEFFILINLSDDKDFIHTMDSLKNKNKDKFDQKFKIYKEQFDNKNVKYIDIKTDIKETKTTNIPKCPTCGSTNIKKISGTKRFVSTGIFGLASSNIGKTMQCKNCGYKW